jgi:hypothetical protein
LMNMLTSFKTLLTLQMSMNLMMLLYLACENNHNGVISILCMVLLCTSFSFYRS